MKLRFLKRMTLRFEPTEQAGLEVKKADSVCRRGAARFTGEVDSLFLVELRFAEPTLCRFDEGELAELGDLRGAQLVARGQAEPLPTTPEAAPKTADEARSESSPAEPPPAKAVPAADAAPAAMPPGEAEASTHETPPPTPAAPPTGDAAGPVRGPGRPRGGGRKKKEAKNRGT